MDEFEIIVDPARPPDPELAAVIIPGIVRRLSPDAHQRCLRIALDAVAAIPARPEAREGR